MSGRVINVTLREGTWAYRMNCLVLAVWGARGEVLVTLAILAGWTLITHGIVQLLGRWASGSALWSLSAGLFLLSLAGWSFLRTMFGKGLYALTQLKAPKRRGDG